MADQLLPALETGWLPTTPPDDTYLRRFLLSWAGDCAASAAAFQGRVSNQPAMCLTDTGRPTAFANSATLLQPLEAATAPALLAQIAAFFRFDDPARSGEVLILSAWPTGDLSAQGWSLMGHPPVLLLPGGAVPPRPPAELVVEDVRDRDGLHAWERVAILGFPFDGLADAPPGTLANEVWLAEPRRRLWLGRVDGRPVSASAAWIEHGINNVTLVATLPEARRRGYGEALTWRATLASPSLPAMLLSSDDGRSVYERMGFLPLQRLTLWYRNRPAS